MERIRVVLTAAVTYLTLAAVVLGIFSEEIGNVFQLPDAVGQVIAAVASTIAVAIAIIRRVEPVIPSRRGLVEPPLPNGVRDRGCVTIESVEKVAAIVVVSAAVVFVAAVLAGHLIL